MNQKLSNSRFSDPNPEIRKRLQSIAFRDLNQIIELNEYIANILLRNAKESGAEKFVEMETMGFVEIQFNPSVGFLIFKLKDDVFEQLADCYKQRALLFENKYVFFDTSGSTDEERDTYKWFVNAQVRVGFESLEDLIKELSDPIAACAFEPSDWRVKTYSNID